MSVHPQAMPEKGTVGEAPAGASLRNAGTVSLENLPVLPYDSYAEQILTEIAREGRVAAVLPVTSGDGLEFITVLARDPSGELLALRTRVDDRFPALTPRCPQLHLFEREIAESCGVLPEGHPWQKPVRFPGTESGREAGEKRAPAVGETEFYRVQGDEVHEVAVGPVHAGVIEPGHFRFQCHGEHVMHLEISLGYQHRGVERLLAGGPHPATIFQMETVAGDSTIGHMTAHCQLLEALSETEPPPRAQALRVAALELERLANHVGDIGALAGDVGFLPTSAFCGRLRGDFLNLTAALCGSRFGRGLVRPGGAAFDLGPEQVNDLLRRLEAAGRDTRGALELFFDTPSVLARLEGVGRVSTQAARDLGLVGPAARACGLVRDVRLQHPAGGWRDRFDAVIAEDGGDVFARATIRRREILESLEIVRRTLRTLPAGPVVRKLEPLRPQMLAVSLVEGWRGEIVHAALTDAAGRLRGCKIVDPSFHNWSGLALAMRQEQISDFPLCNKSFNLSYCGFDL